MQAALREDYVSVMHTGGEPKNGKNDCGADRQTRAVKGFAK